MRILFSGFLLAWLCLTGCSLSHGLRFGQSRSITIAFGSCIKDPNSPFWGLIPKENPDVLLLLGDNIYQSKADFGNAENIRKKYHKLFSAPGFESLLSRVPTYAIWDDHDFGPNNSDSSYAGKDISLAEFRRAWPNNPPPPVGLENSVAFELRVGPALILALDNRSFRQNPAANLQAVMFGEKQLQWVEEKLAHPDAPFVVLAAGSEWLSRTFLDKPEEYENLSQYPDDQQRIFKAIEQSPAEVVMLSGDRHYAEILAIKLGNKRVFDVTSSPLNANLGTGLHDAAEARRIAAVHGFPNFGIVTLDADRKQAEAAIIGPDGRRLLSLPLSAGRN